MGAVTFVEQVGPVVEVSVYFVVVLVPLAGFMALFGWVEEVAAQRAVRLLPWSVVPPGRPRRPTPEWAGPARGGERSIGTFVLD